MAEIPEEVYLAAARAALAADPEIPTTSAEMGENFARDAGLRAAVDAAFVAGWRARLPGEVEMESIRYDRRWCPWHEMLDSDGDDCGDTRPEQEVYPVRIVTMVIRATEAADHAG